MRGSKNKIGWCEAGVSVPAEGTSLYVLLLLLIICVHFMVGNLPEEHAKNIRTSRAKSFSPANLRNDKQAIWKYWNKED